MKNELKNIIVPGELIAKFPVRYGEYDGRVLKIGDKYYSTIFGVKNIEGRQLTVIPYREIYKPKSGDVVIGAIVGYGNSGWFVDIGSYTKAFLHVSEVIKGKFDSRTIELSEYLRIGDIIIAKVTEAERLGYFQLTLKGRGLGKIEDAYFVKVDPVKVGRIIGKRGSMINLIKKFIKGEIILGRNGVIAFKGSYDAFKKLEEIINLITEKTFASGLTNRVGKILSGEVKK